MATTPNIISVYPAPGAQGVVLADEIKVLFDQAMDETSINDGTFVVTGPDNDFIFGPDFNPLDEPGIEDEGILNSPYYAGFVKGEITFQRVDQYGAEIDVTDYAGAGNLYQTLATFVPDKPLVPGVNYTVILAGDEAPTDDFDTGAKTRTVFDTEKVAVSGSGELTFGGGFTNSSGRTYWIEITAGGPTGQAEYIWWEDSVPLTTFPGITTTGRRLLENDVWVECSADGNFSVGDQFRVVCVPAIVLENNYNWDFETGSGAILTPPSDASTTGLVDVAGSTGTSGETPFTVASIVPAFRAYEIDPGLAEIVITFSEAPDPTTVIADNFSVATASVNGNPLHETQGEISFSISLSGNVVTLELDPDQLQINNLVQVEVENVEDVTDGTMLTPYASFFTTTYSPLYTGIRRIRLDLGPFIATVPNETIMLAAYEASLYVDTISFVQVVSNPGYLAFAKRELATCMAELILLRGSVGLSLGQDMSKTLADLKVSRGGGDADSNAKQKDLEECVARWKVPVQTGAAASPDTSLKPTYTVKGAVAEDAIAVGRGWQPTSGIGIGDNAPASNAYKPATARRWVRNYRKRS